MKTSSTGIELIKRYEKFMPSAYVCPAGKLTVGYGHVVQGGEKFPHALTEPEASALLDHDLATRESAVTLLVKSPLTQNQFDALIALVYNIGIFAFKGSSLLRFLNSKQYALAAQEFPKWNKGTVQGQKIVIAGLVRRRKEESDLFTAA